MTHMTMKILLDIFLSCVSHVFPTCEWYEYDHSHRCHRPFFPPMTHVTKNIFFENCVIGTESYIPYVKVTSVACYIP